MGGFASPIGRTISFHGRLAGFTTSKCYPISKKNSQSKEIVGIIFSRSKFSHSPMITIENKEFEKFSRQKFYSEAKNLVTFGRLHFYG